MTARLEQWKQNGGKKAFCITGARQIGKTTVVREFAKTHYSQFIEINFLEDAMASTVFQGHGHPQDLLMALTAYTGKQIIPGETLVLLDEVQECPQARTAIKFLVGEGSCDWVETGSMLGVNIQKVQSYPVGFEEQHPMYPMDFEEFLWALETPQNVLEYLRDCFDKKIPLHEAVHETMLKTYEQYLVAGGMPEAVNSYITSRDAARAAQIQKSILDLYRSDIIKYADKKDAVRILQIYDAIPVQLDAKNQRFMLSQVLPKTRLTYVMDCFFWLVLAGIGLPCLNLDVPQLPFRLNEKRNLFKLFFLDPGLLCAFSMNPVQLAVLNGDLSVNQGSILENAVACQLKANGFELYYYNSKKIGELDFMIQMDNKAVIIEVKSGSDWKQHTAMQNALHVRDWKFGQPIVLCKGNLQQDGDILYIPCYLTMFLAPPSILSMENTKFPDLDFDSLPVL